MLGFRLWQSVRPSKSIVGIQIKVCTRTLVQTFCLPRRSPVRRSTMEPFLAKELSRDLLSGNFLPPMKPSFWTSKLLFFSRDKATCRDWVLNFWGTVLDGVAPHKKKGISFKKGAQKSETYTYTYTFHYFAINFPGVK